MSLFFFFPCLLYCFLIFFRSHCSLCRLLSQYYDVLSWCTYHHSIPLFSLIGKSFFSFYVTSYLYLLCAVFRFPLHPSLGPYNSLTLRSLSWTQYQSLVLSLNLSFFGKRGRKKMGMGIMRNKSLNIYKHSFVNMPSWKKKSEGIVRVCVWAS